MKGLDGKGRCILVWGLTLLIPLTLIVAVGWPWLERVGALNQTISSGEDRLARYQRLIATLPGLRAELEQVRSNEDVKAFTMTPRRHSWPVRSSSGSYRTWSRPRARA